MITRLDNHVGRILDKLKQHGLDSNTIVFFTSDNGPWAGHDVNFFNSGGPLRGVKREMYEGGIRVPLVARWPGHIKPDSVSDHICAFWDFLPTAADLAGLPAPPQTDGISFAPTLTGGVQREHDHLYWDYGHVRNEFKQCAREDKWKGVRNGVNSPIELYNLEANIGETRNLAADHPQVVRSIESIFHDSYTPSPDYPVAGLNGVTS
jgi:arylsulfatase A-like enzyme